MVKVNDKTKAAVVKLAVWSNLIAEVTAAVRKFLDSR